MPPTLLRLTGSVPRRGWTLAARAARPAILLGSRSRLRRPPLAVVMRNALASHLGGSLEAAIAG